jgi:hypothetical protein
MCVFAANFFPLSPSKKKKNYKIMKIPKQGVTDITSRNNSTKVLPKVEREGDHCMVASGW